MHTLAYVYELAYHVLMITASHQTYSNRFWCLSGQPKFDLLCIINRESQYIYKRKKSCMNKFQTLSWVLNM